MTSDQLTRSIHMYRERSIEAKLKVPKAMVIRKGGTSSKPPAPAAAQRCHALNDDRTPCQMKAIRGVYCRNHAQKKNSTPL